MTSEDGLTLAGGADSLQTQFPPVCSRLLVLPRAEGWPPSKELPGPPLPNPTHAPLPCHPIARTCLPGPGGPHLARGGAPLGSLRAGQAAGRGGGLCEQPVPRHPRPLMDAGLQRRRWRFGVRRGLGTVPTAPAWRPPRGPPPPPPGLRSQPGAAAARPPAPSRRSEPALRLLPAGIPLPLAALPLPQAPRPPPPERRHTGQSPGPPAGLCLGRPVLGLRGPTLAWASSVPSRGGSAGREGEGVGRKREVP